MKPDSYIKKIKKNSLLAPLTIIPSTNEKSISVYWEGTIYRKKFSLFFSFATDFSKEALKIDEKFMEEYISLFKNKCKDVGTAKRLIEKDGDFK